MVGRTCGRGSSKGIMLASGIRLDYSLAYAEQAQTVKNVKQNADHLSLESPSDALAGKTAPLLCQFSVGLGGGHRPGRGRNRPMGITRPGRAAPAPTDDPTTNNPPPSGQKVIITDILGRNPKIRPIYEARRVDIAALSARH